MNQNLESNKKSTISQNQNIWINPVHGYIYQLKVLMLFLYRGLSCKYSFRIGTEIKEAQKFDDLVFEYIENNKKVYRLLQAKHKFDETKKITVEKLLTDARGDYSLVKYFYSFQTCKKDKFFKDGVIKDVIICTNIDFDFDDLKNVGIELKKVEEKDDILDIQSNEKHPAKYKFTNSMVQQLKVKLKPTESDDDIQNFLSHLIFAVNQPNEDELGEIVKKEIGKEMGFLDTENAYNKLLVKMMELSLGKRNSKFLCHQDGKSFFDDLKKEIPIWFNIQDPVFSFTGRLDYLEKMHEALAKNFKVCISGMGGVGKSELARKYVATYGHEYDNQVVWMNAESYRSAADSFRHLASDKLNISLNSSDGKEKQLTSVVTDVYQFFSKSKSLFIFDNAEKFKSINELDHGIDKFLPYLPDKCLKPNIIITSRNQRWPESIKIIVLEVFKAKEAREFVKKMLALQNDEEKELIDELGQRLQFLPLALQQAVAYIKMQKEKMACIDLDFGINNYLEKYSNMTEKFLEFSEDSDSTSNKNVFTTWNITFDTLKEKEYGDDALHVLNMISYFLPDNIPVDLLLTLITDEEKLSSAIGLLKQYSIINVQHKYLSIHRLVQQVTRIKLQKENDEVNILQNTLRLLNKNNVNLKTIDHVISIWTFAKKHSQLIDDYSRITTNILDEFIACGRYDEAISIGNEVVVVLKASPRNDLRSLKVLLAILNNVALCDLKKGEYKWALKQFQEIHAIQKDIMEPSDTFFLSTKSNIASVLHQLGRNKEALKFIYEVLEAHRMNLGEDHPEVLLAKINVGSLLSEEGNYQETISILQEVYNVRKQTLGDRHVKTLWVRGEIAINLGNLGKDEESLKILNEVCSDQEAILPKNHPNILHTKCSIAGVLAALQKCAPALKIYRDLLDIRKEKFGENHPEVIDIEMRIGNILRVQGKYEEARKILNDVLDKQKTIFGLMHPKTLITQGEIANVYLKQAKYTNAVELYKDLLNKRMTVLGENHPATLDTRRHILLTLIEQEEYDEALKLSMEALQISESVYAPNHPSIIIDKTNLGMIYYFKRDYNKALVFLRQVLELQESSLGKNHIDYKKTKYKIASILAEKAKFNQNKSEGGHNVELNKPADINTKDAEGRTKLHHALNANDERQVESLLKQGAEVFVTSNKGNTPLHIAALKGQEKFVKLLLQKVKPERLNEFVDVKTSSSGSTALHVAAQKGHYEIVTYLLKSHATFCAKNKDGKTPLDLSSDSKVVIFLKTVHELFEKLEQADSTDVFRKLESLTSDEFLAATNTRNDQGRTLVQMGILSKQKEVTADILKMIQKIKVV